VPTNPAKFKSVVFCVIVCDHLQTSISFELDNPFNFIQSSNSSFLS
jgi:hypothetical protein